MRALSVRFRDPGGGRQEAMLNVGPDFTVQGPLVSCLMVSRGDPFPAAFAIDCFRRQTYAPRELVIVSAATDGKLAALIAEIGDPMIRYISSPQSTLGELRNTSAAHANGELVCQWDDDDLSAPDRIALMVATMAQPETKACFLRRVTLWWPTRRRIAISSARTWENTMLVRREALPIYAAQNLSEDTAVAGMICRHHRVADLTAPESYVYIHHGANAWGAGHFEMLFAAADPAGEGTEHDRRIAAMALPLADYARAVKAGD